MKNILYVIVFGILVSCKTDPTSSLVNRLEKSIDQTEGTFAISYFDLDKEEGFEIHPDTVFHAASTMKTPVMIELYRQSESGKFSLKDSIEVITHFRSIVDSSDYVMDVNEDSEGTLYKMVGKKIPMFYLMEEMITKSSNLATNILIQKVGASNVTATMRTLGADKIEVLRGVEDIKAYEAGLSNTTTSHDLMKIYEAIANGTAASPQDCKEMEMILSQQKFNEMIPAQLPENVIVAHKTGNITGVCHDSGIVYTPEGSSYVLVILSKNLPDSQKGTEFIADLSKQIYDYHIRTR